MTRSVSRANEKKKNSLVKPPVPSAPIPTNDHPQFTLVYTHQAPCARIHYTAIHFTSHLTATGGHTRFRFEMKLKSQQKGAVGNLLLHGIAHTPPYRQPHAHTAGITPRTISHTIAAATNVSFRVCVNVCAVFDATPPPPSPPLALFILCWCQSHNRKIDT